MTAYKRWSGSVSTTYLEDGAVTTAKIAADAVTSAKIVDGGVALADHSAGSVPIYHTVKSDDAKTMSREENVAAIESAIALATSLQTVTNAHAADAAEHVTAADATNYPVSADVPTDLATLLSFTGLLLTAYDVHDDDAELGAAWLYHEGQETGDHSAVSSVTPTTLQEAVTRLNDLKAKYNLHDADATAHLNGTQHAEATADAAYGAVNEVVDSDVLSGDVIDWAIIDSGTGTVVGVTAVAGAGVITFTFDADPQNDAIISYSVKRLAT